MQVVGNYSQLKAETGLLRYIGNGCLTDKKNRDLISCALLFKQRYDQAGAFCLSISTIYM